MSEKDILEKYNDKLSPMMKHYLETKVKYNDSILFYRLGDFYEMFFDDAINVSRELELTLTGKDCGLDERAPMCGIPFHAAETYIAKLVENGHKVAICEQLEDPKQAKGIVKRDVIKVVTPGTLTETNLLEEKKNNYIMSIFKSGIYFGISVCDISTGDFYASEIKETNNFDKLLDEISRYSPSEILANSMFYECQEEVDKLKQRFDIYLTRVDDRDFIEETDLIRLLSFVKENGTEIDVSNMNFLKASINGMLSYIVNTQKQNPQNLNKVIVYEITKYMSLDISARRNLEIVEKLRDKSKKGTLLWVLDKTGTSMGGRKLRSWISSPLIDEKEINLRLDAVEELKGDLINREELINTLKGVYDIERLAGKISYGSANARDLNSLKISIKKLPEIKQYLAKYNKEMLVSINNNIDPLEDIFELIDSAIVDDPPIQITEGSLIKKGFDPEIDELKTAMTDGKNWLARLEAEEKEKTGIKNLKVGFNKVFGYYIEVTNSFLSQVPEDRFIRKQTLTGGERFITEELKNLENKILGAEERVTGLEYQKFVEIRDKIKSQIRRLEITASSIASLDVLCSFAKVAEDMNYSRPIVDNSGIIDIEEGRHPVIEKITSADSFIPNDTYLDKDTNRLSIITGPNMAGKSTYMRQVALISLMAQVGSFVPASRAHLGIVDKIFTRVGASDDLAMGQSTFMVEMMEVANILKDATSNSLVILDEIGRGTSTYDGLSIAWAVAEYISNKEKCGAKTLFATHYHELIDLENKLEGVKNYSVAVKEKGEDIIFLRKIVEGGTDESYGVHVAKLAGVPNEVTKRANEILKTIERSNKLNSKKEEKEDKKQVSGQLDMFNYKIAEIAHEIDKIDVNNLTPIDALNIISKIKDQMK